MKKESKGLVCPCGTEAEWREDLLFGGYKVRGWKCSECGESYFHPEDAEKILLENKRKFKNKSKSL